MQVRDPSYKIGFARLGIFVFVASIAGILYNPLSISYKTETSAVSDGRGGAPAGKKRIEFRGFAGLASAPVVMLLSTFMALLVLILEVPAVPGVCLLCVQVACFLELVTYTRRSHADTPNNRATNKPTSFYSADLHWPTAAAWFLFATQYFYSTGHQASLTTIQWTSGLVGLEKSHIVASGALVAFNTTSAYVLFGIGLPLLATWRYGRDYMLTTRSKKETQLLAEYSAHRGLSRDTNEYFLLADHRASMYNQIFRTILAYSVCTSVQTLTSVVSAAILRRHLMVWKVFAPRVIFDSVALLFTDVGILVGFLFVVRLRAAFKRVVQHETEAWTKQNE